MGTSIGGIVGMLLVALPNTPIQRLVLKNLGPFISKKALKRIAAYVGLDPHFQDLNEVEHYLREINAPFGELTDDQWTHYARHRLIDWTRCRNASSAAMHSGSFSSGTCPRCRTNTRIRSGLTSCI